MDEQPNSLDNRGGLVGKIVGFCLTNRLIVVLLVLAVVFWGVAVAPFDWQLGAMPRSPVPVDAIPDIGENQQIVFTKWPGRSPQDVDDQITYPLTSALLGVPGVKTIRSSSMFGFSSIYVIFKEFSLYERIVEGKDFYWTRSRILEKLNSLPPGTLPPGVSATLGPDATALGQVFWYTLEGRDKQGRASGGWDLQELRSIEDWNVRLALQSVEGVAEVASIGGFVKEYQIDVAPDAVRAAGVGLDQVFAAVRASNVDVGARTIEVNRVEYVIRGVGFIKSISDIENTVVKVTENVPILIKDIAKVSLGPALRRGVLDKEGAEAVGGVVVVRYGENPLKVIKRVKEKIAEISLGLPEKRLSDGTTSKVAIVPFYDRTGLIYETLGTLNDAIAQEILVTIIVILILLRHIRSSILISGLLPLAVLMCFIAMKIFGVDANIVALSGIAIAIGTMVDMGIVVCENIVKHISKAGENESLLAKVFDGVTEVGSAVVTAIATTVVGFLPVFTMSGAEGKLFKPLAFTKTFALLASVIVALVVIPPLAYMFYKRGANSYKNRGCRKNKFGGLLDFIIAILVGVVLTKYWLPLGPDRGLVLNLLYVFILFGLIMLLIWLLYKNYERMLRWCLRHKVVFVSIPCFLVVWSVLIWRGMGQEFMPALDEGSFLYMPTTMPHASIGEATDMLARIDKAIYSVPEVETVVGKIGRVESPLDPAPISMVETVINYKSEYKTDKDGRLILDDKGRAIRQWRKEIRSPEDIWREIVRAAELPGTTSAPPLQPIETRLVMLQSGLRAPMGVKIQGPSLSDIEKVGFEIEKLLKEVPSVNASTVFADRIIAKPYVEIRIDRAAIARYGIRLADVQNIIEISIGGKRITTTVEGRERYPVRVRYMRELRDRLDTLGKILVPAPGGRRYHWSS